ncbi:MAG: GNAT family N-acetyltransferase [Pseudomonadota bacterium]
MPEGRVRRARRGDIAGLLALESHFPTDRLSRANFRHLLTRGHADLLVFEQDARVVGDAVILYRRGTHTARLYSLVTNPAHRGQGIATRLIAAAERAARHRRCNRICLEARPGNRAAIGLYRALGYYAAGRRAGFYEDGRDALVLEKHLASR